LRTEALQAQARAEEVTRRLQAKLRKEQRRCAALQSESDALLRAQESIRSRGDSLAEQLLSAERRIAEADTAARTGTVLHARDFELLQQRAEDEAQRADALQRELNSTKVLIRSSSGSSSGSCSGSSRY
jgi:predicted RNase H-like nuclease (RuvC/YqgF family)